METTQGAPKALRNFELAADTANSHDTIGCRKKSCIEFMTGGIHGGEKESVDKFSAI